MKTDYKVLLGLLVFVLLTVFAVDGKDPSVGFVFYNKPFGILKVPYGDNIVFNCSTNGTNVTTSLLKKYNNAWVALPHSNLPINIVKKGDVFTITDMSLSTVGNYKCHANDSTRHTIEWPGDGKFLIPDPFVLPTMSIFPNHLVVITEGESTNFTCQSVRSDFFELTWYKMIGQSDIPIPADRIVTINGLSEKKLILMIKHGNKDDSSNYKCVLKYRNKQGLKIASLRVMRKITPKILSSSQYLQARDGQDVKLKCVVEGRPAPQIRWYKASNSLNTNWYKLSQGFKYLMEEKTFKRYEKYNGTVKISKVTYPKDDGLYRCEASNRLGSAVTYMVVQVQEKPVLEKGSNIFKGPPRALSCTTVKGNPTPKFTWEMQLSANALSKKPDAAQWMPLPTKFNRRHTVKLSYGYYRTISTVKIPLFITNAFYRCTATNALGIDSRVIHYIK